MNSRPNSFGRALRAACLCNVRLMKFDVRTLPGASFQRVRETKGDRVQSVVVAVQPTLSAGLCFCPGTTNSGGGE